MWLGAWGGGKTDTHTLERIHAHPHPPGIVVQYRSFPRVHAKAHVLHRVAPGPAKRNGSWGGIVLGCTC